MNRGGHPRWIGGVVLAAQVVACGGKAIGCPSDALDCIDDTDDSSHGGATAQTGSTGVGGSTGLGGGSALGGNGQGGMAQSGTTRPATASGPPPTSTGSGGSLGAGTTGEGNARPAGFAGAGGSTNGANSGTARGNSGAAGVSGSSGSSIPAPPTAPPCPAVAATPTTPRPSCLEATPVSSSGATCTESWCNRPTVPSVVTCETVTATLGDAYHYTVNGDTYDATFSFDADRAQSGTYPDRNTFTSVRLSLDVGLTDHGTRIVDRIEVPAALALARGIDFIGHTIVGTLALRAGDLDQSDFERPIYHSGCSPIIDRSGLPTPGPCACGFAEISLNVPVYVPLARVP